MKESLQTKELRRKLHALILALQAKKWSAEVTLTYRSLQMAKAHLGKALGQMGQQDPYERDRNMRKLQGTRDIAPEVDVSDAPFPLSGDALRDTDALREEISLILKGVKKVFSDLYSSAPSGEVFDSLAWCEQHLTEARFWLGYELGRLREYEQNLAS